jgi:CBS domain containing-hemolysin-like protein
VEVAQTIDEALDVAISAGYSRLPACEGGTDNVVGLVFLKDLARRSRAGHGEDPVRTALRPAVFVPETKRVAELLREMQTRQFHMAIVVDEYGDTAGLVTLEDLLEEIVGEIADEYDVERPPLEHLPDGGLRVAGSLSINDLNDELGVDLPHEEWDTVGGLVFTLLGHVPAEGETVTFQGFELATERVVGRRIASVLIHRVVDGEARDGLTPAPVPSP